MTSLANPPRRLFLAAIGTAGLAVAAGPARGPGMVARTSADAKALQPPGGVAGVAQAGLQRVGHHVAHRDVVAVADFSRASSEPRLLLVDMVSGRIERLLVTHGRGSDPDRTGWLKRFSDAPGSDCTSRGAFLTGPIYVGEHGRSMRLAGLDATNSHAQSRAIVIHPAWYASPEVVRDQGMLGRSNGCFAVSQADAGKVLARLGPGRLLIATRLT